MTGGVARPSAVSRNASNPEANRIGASGFTLKAPAITGAAGRADYVEKFLQNIDWAKVEAAFYDAAGLARSERPTKRRQPAAA